MKDDSRFNAPRRSEYAPDPQAALAFAVKNFLETPAPKPTPTPKRAVTLGESFEDLGKRFPDATVTQKAAILMFGSA